MRSERMFVIWSCIRIGREVSCELSTQIDDSVIRSKTVRIANSFVCEYISVQKWDKTRLTELPP